MTTASQNYPLIFQLTNEIRCQKFTARVLSQGRALMVFEEGEWWCHGVEPGGMTEHGENPGLAFAAFKVAYQQILQDLAEDSKNFGEFQVAVNVFVNDADRIEAERWTEARTQIRVGGKPIEAPFDALRRITSEVPAWVLVQELQLIQAGEEMVALAQAA